MDAALELKLIVLITETPGIVGTLSGIRVHLKKVSQILKTNCKLTDGSKIAFLTIHYIQIILQSMSSNWHL